MQPGVYPAAVTPHRRDGHEADYGAMLELVDFLSRFGTQGVCLLGETGEFLNIRFSDRIRLIHLAVKRSRVPVIAGVSHSTLDGAIELASEAISSDAGAGGAEDGGGRSHHHALRRSVARPSGGACSRSRFGLEIGFQSRGKGRHAACFALMSCELG